MGTDKVHAKYSCADQLKKYADDFSLLNYL